MAGTYGIQYFLRAGTTKGIVTANRLKQAPVTIHPANIARFLHFKGEEVVDDLSSIGEPSLKFLEREMEICPFIFGG